MHGRKMLLMMVMEEHFKPCLQSDYQNLFEFNCCIGQLLFIIIIIIIKQYGKGVLRSWDSRYIGQRYQLRNPKTHCAGERFRERSEDLNALSMFEHAKLYGEPSILTVAKAGRIRWLGHVERMPDS